MNLGTYFKSEIVIFVTGLNSNVFCVVKIDSIFKEGSIWAPPLRIFSFSEFRHLIPLWAF